MQQQSNELKDRETTERSESLDKNEQQQIEQPNEQREKICIRITEGCLRYCNEEPDLEEQFILRLPPDEAQVVQEALDSKTLNERLSITVERNLRDAHLTLDDMPLRGKFMDLPAIVESYKAKDSGTLFKTADIGQILICENAANDESATTSSVAKSQKSATSLLQTQMDFKYPHGLCPPMKNVRKHRFRKIQLEKHFDPDVDRAVKLLLRADGAAESVRFEIDYEGAEGTEIASTSAPSECAEMEPIKLLKETELFGETISLSSEDEERGQTSNGGVTPTENNRSELDFSIANCMLSDSDSDIGDIEKYDPSTLTEEQKQHLAQLKEIDWCLSYNCVKKLSPPRPPTRGRGRPRLHPLVPNGNAAPPRVSMAGRGGRGRPPGRGRGRPPGRGRGTRRGRPITGRINDDIPHVVVTTLSDDDE